MVIYDLGKRLSLKCYRRSAGTIKQIETDLKSTIFLELNFLNSFGVPEKLPRKPLIFQFEHRPEMRRGYVLMLLDSHRYQTHQRPEDF